MCGIAGIVQWQKNADLQNQINSLTRSISHRGPDGEGIFVRENVAIGNRRLAIIDLETGQQPMWSADGMICVTFNGEIYNYRELTGRLKSFGRVFRTKSDTEVILHAWEQWGQDCVKEFRGMFALAIFDWHQRLVFLARDHFGMKPLYYTIDRNHFVFASELNALEEAVGNRFEIDIQAMDQFLFLQYIPAPRTIFRNVLKLPPASSMIVKFDGSHRAPQKYWSLSFEQAKNISENEWLEQLESVIRESVKSHLVSDVPFGVLLSGGLDSTIVTGMMAQELQHPVRTFSVGFEEEHFNELPYARKVASYWKTEHHELIVKSDVLASLPSLIRHYGEPFGDSSAIPTFALCRFARESVPMVLSGDGGDEALGGYDTYRAWLELDSTPEKRRDLNSWQSLVEYFSTPGRMRLWKKQFLENVGLPVQVFDEAFASCKHFSPLHQAQFIDYQTYLPNDILNKSDIASMAHGLELRTPFVDVRVVEFAATIPTGLKIEKGSDGKWNTKKILRSLLMRHFDSDFVYRSKKGFTFPLGNWFKKQGSLRKAMEERLRPKKALIYQYLNYSVVDEVITSHDQGKDMSGLLWLLFYLESWLDFQDRIQHP